MSVEVVSSKTVFRGRAFNVRQDQVRLLDGKVVQLDIVDHENAVTMIPVDSSRLVCFIRQYRHAAEKNLLELPAGVMEKGETPEISAQREMREEIGMAAHQLQRIGGFFLAPGYSTEYMHVFLATHLYESPLPADETEVLHIEKVPLDQVAHLVETGQIQDAKSLAALNLARSLLAAL